LAQQLQFTSLPDLFFSVTVKKGQDAGDAVEEQASEFNDMVKNALKRKLKQYHAWKDATYTEMKSRRGFTIKYLEQHYQVIKMYMQWVKPYIKHIERLSGSTDLLNNPRMIAAFESSLIEVELLARMIMQGAKDSYVCLLLTFEYSTKPSMQFTGDSGYHRGPVHVGATRITWRSYAWNMEQIKNYQAMRDKQDMELLSSVDESLKSAMDALGDDLFAYLEEARRTKRPEEEKEEKPKGGTLFEPFISVGKGVGEVFGVDLKELWGGIFPKQKQGSGEPNAAGLAKKMCWVHYSIFKKAHGLLAW